MSALVLWLAAAFADPPVAEEPAPPEIVVIGTRSEDLRNVLEAKLHELGYGDGKRKDGRTVFRNGAGWKASVILWDDGQVTLVRDPPSLFIAGIGKKRGARNALCLGPGVTDQKGNALLPAACAEVDGWLVSKRRLLGQKDRVLAEIAPLAEDYRAALADERFADRLIGEIPAALRELWEDGRPLRGSEILADPPSRRRALLDYWASRTESPQGEAVRTVVLRFLASTVQRSAYPVTAGEAETYEAQCGCRGLHEALGI